MNVLKSLRGISTCSSKVFKRIEMLNWLLICFFRRANMHNFECNKQIRGGTLSAYLLAHKSLKTNLACAILTQ